MRLCQCANVANFVLSTASVRINQTYSSDHLGAYLLRFFPASDRNYQDSNDEERLPVSRGP